MRHVEVMVSDRKLEFQEALEEKCLWLQVFFDYSHIVKNFNDKVLNVVRKDKQHSIIEECNLVAAKDLKKTRYILTASRMTLHKKDEYTAAERVIHKGSGFFKTDYIVEGGV